MLLLASVVLASSTWASAPSCPTAFTAVNTTIGAVSNSSQLTICASKAVLIKGVNGSLNLVLGSQVSSAPSCLVYPNGLSMDLTYGLLSSGHVGCWSLYPPNQSVAIVNVGKPSQVKLQAALKSFKPEVPRIFFRPTAGIKIQTSVNLYSTARSQLVRSNLLGIPAQIRFKPVKYKWTFSPIGSLLKTSSLAKPTYIPKGTGQVKVLLTVSYSVEYLFTGITNWTAANPDILTNANAENFNVGSAPVPPRTKGPPRLVNEPCGMDPNIWRC